MIGLRAHRRDAALPARAGDAPAPSEAEVLALVAAHLAPASVPVAAEWSYARWKPAMALTAAYEVSFADGARRTVTAKFHAGGKLGAPRAYGGPFDGLRSSATVPELGLSLTVFPYDRELGGLERCFDLRRVARHVDDLGCFAPLRVRPGPSKVSTLRYKPERRSVLLLDLRLREHDGAPRVARKLIARVHPAAAARTVAERRAQLARVAPRGLAPALVGCEERTGVLLEEWLAIEPCAPDAFENAGIAGELLARLHALPCALAPETTAESFDEWRGLVPAFGAVGPLFARAPSTARVTWLHGDFHPDQIAASRDGDGWRLLDLDQLRAGDPVEDLAAWIGDHLAQRPCDWRDAARPLLDGYARAGGELPGETRLAATVARALVRLAAGSLRRLEHGAADLATQRLELARTVATSAGNEAGSQVAFSTLPLALGVAELAEQGRVEVLAHRPGRRLTLRFVAEDGTRVVIKGYRRGRDVEAVARARIAHEAARGLSARVPALLEHDRELCASITDDLGGVPLALGSLDLARIERFGADLRRFQDAKCGADLAEHTLVDELAVVDRLLEREGAAGVRSIPGWNEARATLADLAPRLDSTPAALAHRDLHDGQLLDLGERFGWIDFDLACRADDALDAGNLAAHFELRALQGVEGMGRARVDALRAAFLRGLGRESDPGFAARLAFFESATFVRLALVYFVRPPWAHLSPTLVELARDRARRIR